MSIVSRTRHKAIEMLASQAHLPNVPATIWQAVKVEGYVHTCSFIDYSAEQLLAQLNHLEHDVEFPHRDTLQKVRSAIDFTAEQIRHYGLDHIAFSFNGGKDCTVLLHLLRLAFQQVGSSLDNLICIYFKEPNEFVEISSFMNHMRDLYRLNLDEMSGSFKNGLIELQARHPIRAIFMGQRVGDPGCTMTVISPSDAGWPDFDRINPLIDWTYHDVWVFLKEFRLPYCALYDRGYTSLGHRFNTVPNPALLITHDGGGHKTIGHYRPAWQLVDESKERDGRISSKQH